MNELTKDLQASHEGVKTIGGLLLVAASLLIGAFTPLQVEPDELKEVISSTAEVVQPTIEVIKSDEPVALKVLAGVGTGLGFFGWFRKRVKERKLLEEMSRKDKIIHYTTGAHLDSEAASLVAEEIDKIVKGRTVS